MEHQMGFLRDLSRVTMRDFKTEISMASQSDFAKVILTAKVE
jgi:hypothetical protein